MDKLHREPPKSYPKMIDRRLQQIRFTIEDLKLDGLVVSYLPNIRYLTNFSGSSAFLFILQNEIHFVTDDRYEMQAKGELYPIPGMKIHTTREVWKYLVDQKFLGETQTLGFEADRMPYSEAVEIRNIIRPMKFKPAPGEIEPFTMAKDPEELEFIEKASKMATDVYEYMKSNTKSGMTEAQISNLISFKCRELGSEGMPFHTIVTSGSNTALPHIRPTNRKVKKGDLVIMDFGCTVNGFASSICRTIAIGSATKDQQTIYNMLLESQNATFENLRPGINGKILETYARKIINEGGYGDYYKTNLGHGVGISYDENPRINSRDEAIVPDGCVIAVEPAVYLPNKFGVRVKDCALVTTTGAKQITMPPERIEIV
jgi:Xaa-Pro aminopeptidase